MGAPLVGLLAWAGGVLLLVTLSTLVLSPREWD